MNPGNDYKLTPALKQRTRKKIRECLRTKESGDPARTAAARRALWRGFLIEVETEFTTSEMRNVIEFRKRTSSKRKIVWKTLKESLADLQKQELPWLMGFIVFGSFVNGYSRFSDVDMVAIADSKRVLTDPRFKEMPNGPGLANLVAK